MARKTSGGAHGGHGRFVTFADLTALPKEAPPPPFGKSIP